MTPALLREIGEALWGRWWIGSMARSLSSPLDPLKPVATRTVERWESGERSIPDGVAAELVASIDAKIAELRALRKKLRS